DYIFRLLALEYLDRTDLVQVPPQVPVSHKSSVPIEVRHTQPSEINTELAGQQTQEYLAGMMGDAPVCHNCGHITIRSGSCYKCLNCGTSLGCS
ncbi:MAG: hypothetical protein KBB38_12955, partial [Bacteroidia bacterium]|nr:hypothetical protein [Bacteroidia bacterium]